MAAPAPARRGDIQGLRALAVALVVLDHAGLGPFHGGYVGVDVFFVVSGFLITSLLLREADATGRIGLARFYARRARRILPAATVVLLATLACAAPRLPLTRMAQLATDVRWSACFAANVHFSRVGGNYFEQDRAVSPVQHFWSLAVEEQFYLVWPVVLGLVLLATGAGRAGTRRRVTVLLLAAVAAASLAWSVTSTAHSPVTAYYATTTRAWELATGALLACVAGRLGRLSLPARRGVGALGVLAVLLSATGFDATTPFPGWRALLPVVGTAAVLTAGATGPVGMGRLLAGRPVQAVGDLSYSLYLWHWPVLVLGAAYLGSRPTGVPALALVAVASVLAVVTYHLVENPVRRARGPVLRDARGLVLWPVALALTLGGATLALGQARHAFEQRVEALSQPQPQPQPRHPSLPVPAGRSRVRQPPLASRIAASVALAARGGPLPFPLVNLRHLHDDVWMRRFPCYASWGDATSRVCPTGDVTARRTVAVFGDSHAGMWLPPLDVLGRHHGFRVVPFVKVGCGPFDVPQLHEGVAFADCLAFRRWALTRIRRLHPDLVLVAYRGLWAVQPPAGEQPATAWREGAVRTLHTLARLAPRVEVVSDITALDHAPGDCLTDPTSTMASCTQTVRGVTRLGNAVTAQAARSTGARFVDVGGLVCARQRCPLVVDHVVTYRDNAHVTVTWGRRVAGALGRRLGLAP